MVKGHRDLLVWQRSIDFVGRIYDVTEPFPRREIYGLAVQMRRAAVSVSSNIAEGHGRDHLGDYLHHLSLANGSLMELDTQLVIASRRKYLAPDVAGTLFDQCALVARMLAGLTRSLKKLRKRP